MQLPRKGILIRLCIYGPLLAYFGYLAYQKYRAEQAPSASDAPVLEGRKHTFALPDGKSVEVVEITEDQARAMGLDPAQAGGAPTKAPEPTKTPDAAPAAAKAPEAAPPAEAAKSPAPAPAGAN